MLRSTDNLHADHLVIGSGLAVLDAIGRAVAAGVPFPADDCATVIRFVREFVIGVHLHKEATWVWPALAMHGDDRAAADVGDLMRLHEEVVELTHSLMLFWEPVAALSAAECFGFAETAAAVTSRLRRMQALEEGELFGACDEVPPDDRIEWDPAFAQVEAERGGRGQWAESIRALQQRWCG